LFILGDNMAGFCHAELISLSLLLIKLLPNAKLLAEGFKFKKENTPLPATCDSSLKD